MILTIDPGKHACGWAYGPAKPVAGYGLIQCGLWREPSKRRGTALLEEFPNATRAIVECPQHYPRGSTKQANDLIAIALRGGWLAGAMAPNAVLEWKLPREWKGTVDGDVFLTRIMDRLKLIEIGLLESVDCPESLRHNVLDAMGLYLNAVGRL